MRELVMSYFDPYFNTKGVRSLRNYSVPVNLWRFDSLQWRTTENRLDEIQTRLHHVRHYPLITRKMERRLARAEPVLLRACFLNSNPKGLFRPK
jgi:hypothetical protein